MQAKRSKNRTDIILYEKPILKGMLILALPIFFNNILKSLHDMVDMIFLARMSGNLDEVNSALAAVNIHFPTYAFFLAIGTGLGVATVTIISQYLGSKRRDLAKKYSGRTTLLALIFGLVITLGMYFLSPMIIKIMGAKGLTYTYALEYFQIRSIEFIPVFLFIIYQSIRQAEGKTLLPGVINIFGIVINVFLTWLFVNKLQMGVAGAAWSTVIGQSIGLPFIIYGLFFSKTNISIKVSDMKLDKETSKDIFKLMIPAMLASALNSLGFMIIQARLLYYGDVVSSGFAAGNRISQLISNSLLAVTTVMATYIGNNVGNNNQKRAKESYWTALIFIFSLSIVLMVLFIIVRKQLLYLLLGTNSSQELLDYAMTFSFWLLITQPMVAIMWADNAYFNGSGNAFLSFISGLVRLWLVRIPFVYIIAWLFPETRHYSIIIAMMISNVVIITTNYFLKRRVTLEKTVRFDEEVST